MTDQNTTFVSVTLDPESEARLVKSLTEAFNKAFAGAATQMEELTARMTKITADAIKVVQGNAGKMSSTFRAVGTEASQAFSVAERHIIALTNHMLESEHATGLVIRELANLSIAERRQGINAGQAATDAARLQIAEVRNVGIQTNIEGQKAVVVARGVAKSRVLITQGMVRSIILLEKGLGATIQGVAKTAVSAVSKTFSGITGLFRKDTAGISSELARTNAAIQRGVKQGNTELTAGVRGSLSRREELLRSSFRTQEQIVTRSALRQQETLAGLRRGTQTGVLGAANRGLNIGSLIGGFAAIQAARSTFKVGSEFVRGLAVLQAQLNLTEEQMKGVDALSVQLGNDISLPGVSALDAAQAIQILSKQFGSLGDGAIVAAENAAKGTLQLSRAVGASAEDTAGIIGAAVNVFGISADKAITVADAVAGAMTQAAGVSFEDFKTAFVQGATVFENFVGPAESANDVLLDFNTSLAVLAKSGLVGESAGAGLKQFFLSASKQSDKALSLQEDLAKRAGTTGRIFFDAAHKARPFSESLDLLRRSLRGMSDEQKTATLTTLFGVRAQTIATALIRDSADNYDAIRERISKQGLAAKIAAAQNTGFAGALDALKSVIETVQIQLFKKLNPALGAVTLGFASLFNNVLTGTGAFALLRRGLLGVAVGMGAIIAAKGAVEVLKLLGTAAKLALTPFGALLVAAGLLGAAVSILSQRSEPFRKALGELGDRLKDLGGAGIKLVGRALSALGGVIERDVLPFLIQFVNFLSTHVVGAFDAVVRFITDKAIPAIKTAGEFIGRIATVGFRAVVDFVQDHVIPTFQSFVQFVITTVIPIAVRVGGVFKGAFDTALEAVKGFWHTVEPILRPALEGFKTLGRAIAAIFTGGDFSQLGRGFSAVGSGIATSFSTIGKNLLGVLDRLWITLQTWFKAHFSGPQLINLGKGFLDLVEFIGNTLGKIVTSPTFVRAVALLAAGLAAAAVLVAGRFIEGFGKAFIGHLPGLFELLGGAVLDGFVAIFSNPLIATGIALAIFAIFRVVNLAKSFTAAGSEAGAGFLGGLKTGVQNQGRLFAAFATGPQQTLVRSFQGANKSLNKEVLSLQAKLRAFGSSTVVVPHSLDAARKEFRDLSEGIGAAATRGLLLRDAFKQVSSGAGSALRGLAKGVIGGITGVTKGISAALSATNVYNGPATSGAKAFSTAFRDSMRGSGKLIASGFAGIGVALQETAAAQGKSVGAVLGSALAKAAIGAVSVVAGFQAGKAEGASGGSGLLSALLGGVTAGAVIGGPFGAAVGAVTAGAALIGAALGRSEAKAKAFREEVDRLSKSVGNQLVDALEKGALKLNGLNIKGSFADIIGVGDVQKQISDSIGTALKPEQVKVIKDLGLNIPIVIDILKNSGGDIQKFGKTFGDVFFGLQKNSNEFTTRFGANAAEVAGVLNQISQPGGDANLHDFLSSGAADHLTDGVLHLIHANRDFLDSVLDSATAVNTQSKIIAEAIRNAQDLATITAEIPPSPFTNLNAEHGTRGPFADLIEGAKNLGIAAKAAFRDATAKSAAFFLELVRNGSSIEDASAALELVKFPPIDQSIINDWNKQLQGVQDKADALNAAVAGIPDAFAAAGAAALNLPSTVTTAQASITVTSDVSGIPEIIKNVAGGLSSPQGIIALDQLGKDVSSAVGVAVQQGLIKSDDGGATLQAFLTNLQTAALAGITDQPTIDAINAAFLTLFSTLQVQLPDATGAILGAQLQQQLLDYTKAHPFTTQVAAEFNVSFANNPNLLSPGDFPDIGNPNARSTVSPGATLLDSLLPTQAEIAAAGKKAGDAMGSAGVQTAAGYAAGIHSKESLRLVAAAVKTLTDAAVRNANTNLKISSPSQVFHEIGGFMTQGLANGITAGASAAGTAAAAAAQAAVDAAKGVITNNPIPLPVSAQVPPQANIISGAEHDRLRALSVGRGVVGSAVQGTPAGQIDVGQAIASLAHFGSKITPGDDTGAGALQTKQELADLVTLARSLVTTAEALAKRGPDINLSIVEAKDARATGRAAIAELRADRMLLKGIR